MDYRRHAGRIISGACVVLLLGMATPRAQQRTLTAGQSKIEPQVTVDLAEVGLAGNAAAVRVTIAPGIMTSDHTHTGRTSILVMIQGVLTEVRGGVKREYKPGDVVAVGEGVTHHAENYGTEPIVYVEINTTAKK